MEWEDEADGTLRSRTLGPWFLEVVRNEDGMWQAGVSDIATGKSLDGYFGKLPLQKTPDKAIAKLNKMLKGVFQEWIEDLDKK